MDLTAGILALLLAYFGLGPSMRVTSGHIGYGRTHPPVVYHCRPALQKALALPGPFRSHLDPALFCVKK